MLLLFARSLKHVHEDKWFLLKQISNILIYLGTYFHTYLLVVCPMRDYGIRQMIKSPFDALVPSIDSRCVVSECKSRKTVRTIEMQLKQKSF